MMRERRPTTFQAPWVPLCRASILVFTLEGRPYIATRVSPPSS